MTLVDLGLDVARLAFRNPGKALSAAFWCRDYTCAQLAFCVGSRDQHQDLVFVWMASTLLTWLSPEPFSFFVTMGSSCAC